MKNTRIKNFRNGKISLTGVHFFICAIFVIVFFIGNKFIGGIGAYIFFMLGVFSAIHHSAVREAKNERYKRR